MISDKYIISAILIPHFKINFVQDEVMKEQYRKLSMNAVREVYEETTRKQRTMSLLRRAPETSNNEVSQVTTSDGSNRQQPRTVNDDEDLYSFMKPAPPTPGSCIIAAEVNTYLSCSSTSSASIAEYEWLLKTVLKYNTCLPSSAAVERLFSNAGQILIPRRCKVTDDMFKKLVFLRYKL